MLFRSAILSSLVAAAAAKSFVPIGDIPLDSKFGKRIMAKAESVESNERNLENNERDTSWMWNYSIKYMSCSSLIQINGEEGGGEDGSLLYTQNLVKFSLCPAGSCKNCPTGDAKYVVPMDEFVDAWTEMKMEAQERECEYVQENCYCDNYNDDDVCANDCYMAQGMDYCIQYEGDEEFEIQHFLECAEMEGADGNNNNNNNYYYFNNNGNNDKSIDIYRNYWVGVHCNQNDGKSINLEVFMDAGCSQVAKSGTWEALNYGASLPYQYESLVTPGECVSCQQQDDNQNQNNNNNNNGNNGNNNNNNNNQNYELNELCEQSYKRAARCESGLTVGSNYFYLDTSGCNYINNILPRLETATRKVKSSSGGRNVGGERLLVVLAVVFGISTIILGAYSFFLYRKIHRAKVNLSHSEGNLA